LQEQSLLQRFLGSYHNSTISEVSPHGNLAAFRDKDYPSTPSSPLVLPLGCSDYVYNKSTADGWAAQVLV
jgi:hypothetical protein